MYWYCGVRLTLMIRDFAAEHTCAGHLARHARLVKEAEEK